MIKTYNRAARNAAPDRRRLKTAAMAIGHRLEALAVHGKRDVTWVGVVSTRDRGWVLEPLGSDLYDGIAGVILFLAYLGTITREARYGELARSALTTLRRQTEKDRRLSSIGGFIGKGGFIYVLSHLGTLWDEPALLGEATAMAQSLGPLIEEDEEADIIFGAAGCVGALVSLYGCSPSDRVLAAAVRCGDRLLACARCFENGVGWPTKSTRTRMTFRFPEIAADLSSKTANEVALTGFSHGTAGIAWALLVLHGLTGEERFRTAALEALRYERHCFDPEEGNWDEFVRAGNRTPGLGRAKEVAWCYGAPGIGMARLATLPVMDDDAVRAEIETALNTTTTKGFGYNHSLCHGDLGNLEIFLQAQDRLADPRWGDLAGLQAAAILDGIEQDGWICGTPQGIETPSLMTGIAGIGYQLLRLAEPRLVPAVLLLAPPPA